MASTQPVPATFRKLVANRPSLHFREVISIETVSTPQPGDGEILVKNRYVGINASDISLTAGRDAFEHTPFPIDCGFEAMGEVVATGPNCDMKIGQPVIYFMFGVFAEYKLVKIAAVIPLPDLNPDYLPFILSGNTAAIGLEKVADIKQGETVLVTAAAGGTGQFAVQWAKLAGCHVIGTCSTDEKVQILKDLGCDRPINYTKENLGDVLKNEYPKGLDLVYESVGGEVFVTCIENLAVKGRLMILGTTSQYATEGPGQGPSMTISDMAMTILLKGATIQTFVLFHWEKEWAPYVRKQLELYQNRKWKSVLDKGENCATGPFVGLDKIADAVEYQQSKKSIGKVMVELQ